MASSRLSERDVQEEPRSADLHFCPDKHSLLIIVGRPGHTGHISGDIERGIRSWDVDLKSCNLNLYLQEFLSHHTASFKGAGHKCLRHSSRVLDTQVLVSPSQEQVHSEVSSLLSRDSAHKLLILAGQSVEESGSLLFHKGLFSPRQLKQILTEQFTDRETSAPSSRLCLTLGCPNIGQWRKTLLEDPPALQQGPLSLRINPPEVLPAMEALGDFTSLVSGTLCPPSPFDLLPPPTTVGFLKLSRPCCYVFPAGRGDCAFFAVNGFTVLMDGGSDPQACFWKLVRHLDRIDAVLLTHVGTENLPGVNTFLERKVAELELSADGKEDLSKRLISPELGVVFFNTPGRLQTEEQPCVDNVLKSTQQAALTLRLLKKLEIRAQPLFRPQGVPIEPLTLFQKMGVGQLDLYILNPGKNSQEYQTFMQNWPDGASKSQTPPLTALASVSALLVWHPACPQEKVVRVLFPGATPQAKLLQGLEKLKGLAFLQRPTVTTEDLEKLGQDRKTKRTGSMDSGRSLGKESTVKHAKDRIVRKEEEGKDVAVKEKGKVLNGVIARDAEKTKNKETGVKQKPALLEKNASKKGTAKEGKKDEKPGNKEENSVMKNDPGKKDSLSPKPKIENKTKLKKEAKNDSKTGAKKTKKASAKDANNGKKANMEFLKNNSTKPHTGTGLEPEVLDTEQQSTKPEKESEENLSKMSSPEDMTVDFLRLREETEREQTADTQTPQNRESGNEKSLQDKSKNASNKDGAVEKEAAGCTGEDPQKAPGKDQPGHVNKPAKIVGFPSPLNKAPTRDEGMDLQDLTPTEYTLLDGALRSSPPSRSSPENPTRVSPDEETVEPASPDSRPNSAGHTPYCLSPDDVWCNKATLSRIQAQMGNPESANVDKPNGSSKESEGQAKTTLEGHTNSREKQLSFLSLGTFKDGSSDHSPSVATTTTTTTTHSMPAEVSSPQSTEVDESLSMSLEQGPTGVSHREGDDSVNLSHSNGGGHFVGMPIKKPPRALAQGSEMGRSQAPNTLHFENSPHDVDLCLVSPCEFKHFKPSETGSSSSHNYGNNNNNPKDQSPSESNAPVCTEDCPSTTADGALDSDEDDSCSEPSNSPRVSKALPQDPPPAPQRDSPPLAPHPDTSMPVPQSDSTDAQSRGKKAKAAGLKGKKTPAVIEASQKPSSGKSRTGSGVTKGNVSATRTPSFSSHTAPVKSPPSAGSKSPPGGEVGVYVDLAYLPSGASAQTVSVDFFRSVRSACYIISGDSPEREELLRTTLDALLDGKISWPDNMQVTVIPTFDSVPMQEWYQQTQDKQRELGITVLGSNSTVAMQDETFPACKIEF